MEGEILFVPLGGVHVGFEILQGQLHSHKVFGGAAGCAKPDGFQLEEHADVHEGCEIEVVGVHDVPDLVHENRCRIVRKHGAALRKCAYDAMEFKLLQG